MPVPSLSTTTEEALQMYDIQSRWDSVSTMERLNGKKTDITFGIASSVGLECPLAVTNKPFCLLTSNDKRMMETDDWSGGSLFALA